jgi:hypothetical protein
VFPVAGDLELVHQGFELSERSVEMHPNHKLFPILLCACWAASQDTKLPGSCPEQPECLRFERCLLLHLKPISLSIWFNKAVDPAGHLRAISIGEARSRT